MSKLLEVSLLKSAVIQAQFPAAIPPVDGDPSQLRQVVMNLLLNAAEALSDARGVIRVGTGNLRLTTRELSQMSIGAGLPEGSYTYFEVCDTGCGMTAEIAAKIFDPFFTTKSKGRGLGLAAVLGIVRGHRGALQVESAAGLGTIVRVFLPASSGTPAPRLSSPLDISAVDRKYGPVLVVDDEEAIRTSATLLLKALGFSVLTAADGHDAIELFRENRQSICAVVLDLTMPRVSGAEAFRELRQIRVDLPILITSGYSEEDIVDQFRGSGPVSFIQKPYRGNELLARLLDVLSPARK
jgi:CheY-like chemotaxis protein